MPGQRAAQQVLEARVGGGGHRDRVAVAAEPARDPEDADRPGLGRGERASKRCRATRPARSPGAGAPTGLEMRRALDQRLQVLVEPAVQVPVARRAGDEPGPRQPRERVRDRRPLGGDQLAEQPVGERQADADAARARPGPSAPRGARAGAPAAPRAGAGTRSHAARRGRRRRRSARRSRAWAICGQGSTRWANSSSSSANRVGRSARQAASRSIMSSTRSPAGCSRSPAPSSSVTVRSTIRV